MPYQNRVAPTGDLLAVTSRGSLMGNRGKLHNAQGQITKTSDRTAWIYCALEYKGRKQEVMAPGRYTQLFFLDEATALAAGHRPCATCKREAYNAFTTLFKEVSNVASISEIDCELKHQRQQKVDGLALDSLPDGTFVELDNLDGVWLIFEHSFYRWSPGGYCERRDRAIASEVKIITPLSTVKVLKAGYQPDIHDSVRELVADNLNPKQTASVVSKAAPGAEQQSRKKHKAITYSAPVDVSEPVEALFKLKVTPRGSELYAYFAAILKVTGMLDGNEFNLKKFMGNFKGHLDSQRIEKGSRGYRLTNEGLQYFHDRHQKGSRQYVDPLLYQAMCKGLVEGGVAWERLN